MAAFQRKAGEVAVVCIVIGGTALLIWQLKQFVSGPSSPQAIVSSSDGTDGIIPVSEPPSPEATLEKLEFVLRQNQAARDQLKSFQYSYQIDMERTPEGQPAVTEMMHGRVAASGDLQYQIIERDQRIVIEHTGERRLERWTVRSVLNDRYSAVWTGGTHALIRIVEHTSIASMSPETAERLRVDSGERWEQRAFGSGELTLYEVYESRRERPWELVEGEFPNGDKKFVVRLYLPRAEKPPLLVNEWEINADKGFLVTGYNSYRTVGVVGFDRTIEPIQDAETGLWFPSLIIERTYRSQLMDPFDDFHSPRAAELYLVQRVQFDEIELNPTIPTEQFELSALEAPDGTLVARTLRDGTREQEVLVMKSGVPRPQVERRWWDRLRARLRGLLR